jgi:hypothetical protein
VWVAGPVASLGSAVWVAGPVASLGSAVWVAGPVASLGSVMPLCRLDLLVTRDADQALHKIKSRNGNEQVPPT